MKKRLNVLCVLIFIAIAASVADIVREEYLDFIWGFKTGWDQHEQNKAHGPDRTLQGEPLFLAVKPNGIGVYPDSVYNEKTNEWIPLQYRSIVVGVQETAMPWWKLGLCVVCGLIVVVAIFVQIVVFCRFISVINKSVIFEWGNVFKLRLIGWAMLITFFAHALLSIIYYFNNVDCVSLSDYSLAFDGMFDFYQLILGLGVLLMGEVFAIGLRMKEEQELTI